MFNPRSEATMFHGFTKPPMKALTQAALGLLVAALCLGQAPAEARRAGSGSKPPATAAAAGPKAQPAAPRQRTYQTYVKTSRDGKKDYAGRTSGTGTPIANLARRDRQHQRNAEGYGPARLDKSSKSKDAIRGREQQLIERAREKGRSSGQMNGVSPRNPQRQRYLDAARKEFGQ